MPLPIRTICAYCLESVESSVGEDARGPAACPSCGSAIGCEDSSPTEETGEDGSRPASWGEHDAPTIRGEVEGSGPDRIGRFIVGDWIGGGGYGDVYAASDPRLERDVALKILKPTKLDAKATERFLREARAAAKLHHPNIVSLYEAGQDGGRLWIAYQLVKGRTLSQLRDARELGLREAVVLVRALAEALRHAHARGIFHRDLKPANVLVDDEGEPHLTDFGLARRLGVDSELTGEGTILGTPAYMSPEQAAGRAHAADGRSDIYSLGVILYELICGRRPTDLPSNTPFWKVPPKAPPPPPHSVDRAIPHDLDRVCMKALALNPDDRYPDAATFSAALDEWLRRDRAGRSGRRTALGMLGVGLVAVAAMIGLSRPGRGTVGLAAIEPKVDHVALKPVSAGAMLAVAPAPKAAWVVVNLEKGGKIHSSECGNLKGHRLKSSADFASVAEANAAGWTTICGNCGRKLAEEEAARGGAASKAP